LENSVWKRLLTCHETDKYLILEEKVEDKKNEKKNEKQEEEDINKEEEKVHS
jgi:hypothetical protein